MIVGQKWLAEQLLNKCLANSKIEVVAVSTPILDDRLAVLANNYQIPIILHDKVLTAEHIPHTLDIILTAHAHCFIAKSARDKANHGAVGYHPSLLPDYKGKNAINNVINAGEIVTGGSLYQLDEGWDTGKVLMQQSIVIDKSDTALSLWKNKLAPLGLKMFCEYLEGLL